MYEYVIIGAGPSGLQLAYYLKENSRNYIILEKSDKVGSYFRTQPRHRKFLSINKVFTGYDDKEYNLRHDWNSFLCENDDLLFKNYSKDFYPDADDYVTYVEKFMEYYKFNVKFNTEVTSVKKENDFFHIKDKNDLEIKCKYLIICTGLSKPYLPSNIKNLHYAIGYEEMSLDVKDYENKKILIIGKANSAFETANHLLDVAAFISLISKSPVRFAWQTHFAGDLRSVNNSFLDTYQLKALNFITYKTGGIELVKEGNQFYVKFNDRVKYDVILRCTGWKFDDSIFDKNCKPITTLNGQLPDINSDYESTNIKNLYFGGPLMHIRDYRGSSVPFIHGFRYCMRTLSTMLEYKNHNNFYKSEKIPNNYKSIGDRIINRLKNTSALFTLFKYYCDIIVVNKDDCDYYQELPIDYVFNCDFFKDKSLLIIYFEIGWKDDENVFKKERVAREIFNGYTSKYLHPVIKYFSKCKDGYKNIDRMTEKSYIPCICGRVEEKEIMFEHTVCKECLKVAFCRCGRREYLDYFYNNETCRKCNNEDISKMPKAVPSLIKSKSCIAVEHHIMEDLHVIDWHLNCYTDPLFRFLEMILYNKFINLDQYYLGKIKFMFETFKNFEDEKRRIHYKKYLGKPVFPRFWESQQWFFPNCLDFPSTLVKFTKSPYTKGEI